VGEWVVLKGVGVDRKEHFINLLKSRKNEMSESARFKLWPSG